MKSTGTYFEQVPKAIVEKILAKQMGPPEMDLAERGVTPNQTVGKGAAIALRSRKV
ncbi:MAG: hypothetical protein WCC03_03550 [Candidatus Acidiferrales bacterium]